MHIYSAHHARIFDIWWANNKENRTKWKKTHDVISSSFRGRCFLSRCMYINCVEYSPQCLGENIFISSIFRTHEQLESYRLTKNKTYCMKYIHIKMRYAVLSVCEPNNQPNAKVSFWLRVNNCLWTWMVWKSYSTLAL